MNECFFAVVVDYDKLVDRIGRLVYIIVQNIWARYRFAKKNYEVYFVSVTFYYTIHLMSN